ncbi:MAG: DUF2254 domain-containing protein [Chloroflexota bacterium]
MRILKWWTVVRDSLWFIPAIWVVASAVLALVMVGIDHATPDVVADFPLVFGGGVDGARGLLSSIAGSMITVAGVTFSITVVALQLASSQFSPRVLRNFMRDRSSQVVLGAFIGSFAYAILVLRSIRGGQDGAEPFVPSVAVTVGILLALLAMGMFVFFIHHIASRIQLSSIVANIADETTDKVRREWTLEAPDGGPAELPAEPPNRIAAQGSGYLQLVDEEGLKRIATDRDLVLRLDVKPGAWAQQDAPLFSVWPAAAARGDDLTDQLQAHVSLGAQRSIEVDAAFGIRQLVDVALKAISPGINDPTSAADCVVRLGQILVAAGRRHHPPTVHRDDGGQLRLVVPRDDWPALVGVAFDQLRQYGAGNVDTAIAMARTLGTIATAVPRERHAPLLDQLELVRLALVDITPPEDRARVARAVEHAVDAARA